MPIARTDLRSGGLFGMNLRGTSPMKFPFKCNDCGHLNHFEWSQVGQTGECSRCGKLLTVPAPMETTSEDAPPPPARVKFRCPACRRKFATKAEMAGQKIRCTGCGAGVRVPHPDGAIPMPSSQAGVFEFALSDELETAPEPPRPEVARADASGRASAGAKAGRNPRCMAKWPREPRHLRKKSRRRSRRASMSEKSTQLPPRTRDRA